MTWNVQNLFDGSHDGGEYPEFDPENSLWDAGEYHARLEDIARIIRSADADIILLQEIEHDRVLEDLSFYLDASYSYHIASYDTPITQGVLSRYPFTEAAIHQSTGLSGQQRSLLTVTAAIGSEHLILCTCHWKSRLGGAAETEVQRCASASLLKRVVGSLHRQSPQDMVICGGDLNTSVRDNPFGDDFSASAMVPAGCGESEGLLVTGDKSRVSGEVLYDFWLDEDREDGPPGSYSYRKGWLQFDHLMGDRHLFDHEGFDLEEVRVLEDAGLLNADGTPYRFSPDTGAGVSDHLPLLMILTRECRFSL